MTPEPQDDETAEQATLWEKHEQEDSTPTIVPFVEAFPEANPKVHQGIFWDTENQEEVVPDQVPARVN